MEALQMCYGVLLIVTEHYEANIEFEGVTRVLQPEPSKHASAIDGDRLFQKSS